MRHKQAVVEPQESAAFSAAAEDFRAKLADPSSNGAVFFAVCRRAPGIRVRASSLAVAGRGYGVSACQRGHPVQ